MAIVFAIITILLIAYIAYLQMQLRNINRLLSKRLLEKTRQPLSIELINKELNELTANINKCLAEEERLRLEGFRSEKQMKEMIASISHDLRTPLTAIRGYQQLMEKGTLSEEQAQKLNIAKKHSDELGYLIERFFDYSYAVSSEPKIAIERFDLTSLLTECLAESVNEFETNGLSLCYEESPALFVLADKAMTTRIIRNLIKNCIRYSAGEVTIRLTTAENTIISFKNPVKNAIEIDPERIFERFYTADKARKTGTGLGLPIVKLSTEQQGGNVNANMRDGMLEICVELRKS